MKKIMLSLDATLINKEDLIQIIPGMLEPRIDGEFRDKGYWLQQNLEWHVGVDSEMQNVLIATRK